jgi:hypothetical protein
LKRADKAIEESKSSDAKGVQAVQRQDEQTTAADAQQPTNEEKRVSFRSPRTSSSSTVVTQTGRSLKKKRLALELIGAEGVITPAPVQQDQLLGNEDEAPPSLPSTDERTGRLSIGIGTETLPRPSSSSSRTSPGGGAAGTKHGVAGTSTRAKSEERSAAGRT